MSKASIQQATPNAVLANAESYQTFEMAKANDDVLGGDDIAQIRTYAAKMRAQAQYLHKTIAAMSGLEDVAAIKAEAIETEQTFAKISVYADQRIGEILRELPTRQGARTDITSVGTPTKVQAEREANIDHHTAIDLQAMAANPDVVEAVIAKATEDGRVVSRSQVLRAIKERDQAQRELRKASILKTDMEMEAEALRQRVSEAKEEVDQYASELEDAQAEIRALEQQNDELYAQKNPEPKVIEREVEVVPEDVRRRIKSLEYQKNLGDKDNATLRRQLEDTRKELDRAKGILDMDASTRDVQRDVEYLVSATNQYVRRYGGLTWTFERIGEVDDVTREELRKAVKNLATFASALVAGLEEM